jgi:formylglycine-generating enzyme required for sulfatase activity
MNRLQPFLLTMCAALCSLNANAIDRASKASAACEPHCPLMVKIPLVVKGGERQNTNLFVSTHPITFSQWQRCVRAGGCGGYDPDTQGLPLDSPAVNVSFHDSMRYVGWLSRVTGERYRLLYEDEWAAVTLGGRNAAFAWGDTMQRNVANCFDCGSRWDGKSVSPVSSFPANDFGLHDAAGNISHWVSPRVKHKAPNKSFCAKKPQYAAIVGASWADPAKFLAANDFTCFPKVLRDDTIGFRVALERKGVLANDGPLRAP